MFLVFYSLSKKMYLFLIEWMKFEWDGKKVRRNLKKHKVSFEEAVWLCFWRPAILDNWRPTSLWRRRTVCYHRRVKSAAIAGCRSHRTGWYDSPHQRETSYIRWKTRLWKKQIKLGHGANRKCWMSTILAKECGASMPNAMRRELMLLFCCPT